MLAWPRILQHGQLPQVSHAVPNLFAQLAVHGLEDGLAGLAVATGEMTKSLLCSRRAEHHRTKQEDAAGSSFKEVSHAEKLSAS